MFLLQAQPVMSVLKCYLKSGAYSGSTSDECSKMLLKIRGIQSSSTHSYKGSGYVVLFDFKPPLI